MQATPDWFKNAIVYSLDVRGFKDGNHDGRGDLKGLLDVFDYLVQLGVTCIWLSPICASQGRDDGYDIIDYYEIDAALGDFDDFQKLVERAKANDVKLLLDLVINHTSVDHPWFRRAVEQPGSIYYDYYIWQKEKPENTQRAIPLYEALERLPLANERQYLNFLRNHDELDLERLTEEERQLVFAHFAPEPSMIIYDRGIRRRLPPMVGDNVQRVKLSMSLVLSLPGTPVIRYGEEIGMGDDLNLPERRSVRTAMQWSGVQNAGFSDVAPQAMQYPLIRKGPFSYRYVNVVDEAAIAASLLNEVKKMIAIRGTENHFFHEGFFAVRKTDNEAVLAFGYALDKRELLIVHNFMETTANAELALSTDGEIDISVLLGSPLVSTANKQLKVMLPGYSYCWLLLTRDN